MRSVRGKLVSILLIFGLGPLVALGIFVGLSLKKQSENDANTLKVIATTVMDRVERNLYERYGDAQAFGLNTEIYDQSNWYKFDAEAPLSKLLKRYATTYTPIYELSVIVDRKGKLVAANSATDKGTQVSLKEWSTKNFSSEPWFKQVEAGKFLSSKILDGTWVEPAQTNSEVAAMVGGSGRVLTFSSRILDREGKYIAILHNLARMEVVDDVLSQGIQELKANGLPNAQIVAIDKDGKVIANSAGGTLAAVELGADLKSKQWASALKAISGKSGHVIESESKGPELVTGFARSNGALGYKGLGWSVLIRVPSSELFAAVNGQRKVFAGLCLLTLFGTIFGALAFARSMTRPLNEVSVALLSLSEGRTDAEIRHKGRDEFGQLADSARALLTRMQEQVGWSRRVGSGDLTSRSRIEISNHDQVRVTFRQMVQALADMVDRVRESSTDVRETSGAVSEATTAISSASEMIATRSTVILETAEQTSEYSRRFSSDMELQLSKMEQLSTQAQDVVDSIGRLDGGIASVRQVKDEALNTAEAGGQAVSSTLDGIRGIRDATGQAKLTLEQLAAQSDQIMEIVHTISEIAEQTNLLALNAAIEAARAGDHGRGFAVVADEVRKLSERSANSSTEIRELLTSIQQLVSTSRSAMVKSDDAAGKGLEMSEVARQSLEKILDAVQHLDAPIEAVVKESETVGTISLQMHRHIEEASQITAASSTAATSLAETSETVSASVSEIAAASEEQAAMTQELTARAQELTQLAVGLDNHISGFRTSWDEAETAKPGKSEKAA